MTQVQYETETCGRCGGSGRYSYNQIDGDRCYGCSGSGSRLTKRGGAAKAFADTLLDRPITDAKVGDVITYKIFTLTAVGSARRRIAKIEEAPVRSWAVDKVTGEKVPLRGLTVRFTNGEVAELSLTEKVRFAPTEDQVAEIMAYQDNLTKAGKPRKRALKKA
ncbi:hypothetical protein [Sulfitobacter sp. 1A15106]|uniref:hypothetical protein n=1 Tax=Sulfitobacter sp. 1A15106 TaxID=3368590 RepID=UPI003744D199